MNKDLLNILLKIYGINDIEAEEMMKIIYENKTKFQGFIDKMEELDSFIKKTSGIRYEFYNKKSLELFDNCYANIRKNINYLYTGYFFSTLARNNDLSNRCRINIRMKMDNYEFPLEEHLIKYGIEEIYHHDEIYKEYAKYPDFFAHLTLKSVTRNISMVLRETLNYKLEENNKEIRELFKRYIFNGNENEYKNFYRILVFVRNVFSHNIDYEIRLNEDDYKIQKERLGEKGITFINFKFNKGILIKDDIDINIDFNSLSPGDLYEDKISTKQTILFIMFCHNSILYLNNLRLKPFQMRSDIYFLLNALGKESDMT